MFRVFCFASLFSSSLGMAQVKISGKVIDNHNNPLVGTSISILNSYDGATSDSLGNFSFNTTEKEKQVLQATSAGYKSFEQKITIEGAPLTLIISLKEQITELKAAISEDGNMLRGNVIYIDHFGNVVTNISKRQFMEVARGRPYEIVMKTKNIKTILPNYSAIASSDKYPIKNYEGEKLAIFNEAGFLEIAIFRSNPSKVGSANSLLGLNYRDTVSIQFKD